MEPTVHEHKYKIKYTLPDYRTNGAVQNSDICVRILNVNDHKVCVEFTKSGHASAVLLRKHFDEILESALAFSNDAIYIDPISSEAAESLSPLQANLKDEEDQATEVDT